MSELPQSVIGEAEFVVREGLVDVESLLGRDANLELVLRARIGNDLPVMDAVEERPVGSDGPEIVIGLEQESVAVVSTERDLFGACLRVPGELVGGLRVEILDLVLDG